MEIVLKAMGQNKGNKVRRLSAKDNNTWWSCVCVCVLIDSSPLPPKKEILHEQKYKKYNFKTKITIRNNI